MFLSSSTSVMLFSTVPIDTMRNAYAQTTVAPYAVRALPGGPLAAPLEWAELSRLADAQPYTINTSARRLARKGDPWKDIARRARAIHEAERLYGEGERARRTAFAALKYSFETVGDQWKRKARPGPSDPRATKSTHEKRLGKGTTFGGVDYHGHSKADLYKRARSLRIEGRSNMSKWQLARAIARKQ